ncbi:sugar ABC transporter ATP-binding protein [uncultured Jatrophihabitans sp.]|uniref:sugar ABC transporter ATP-binding protein n=1 Tax=uncultured Jatrophihabitans sp. TaxID=1610747 RepID=UPI0035CA1662
MSEGTASRRDVAALQVEHLGVAFPGVRALHDVSLTVRAGEVHALLGENGAGKSTLIKVVTGAQKPHQGTVRVAGRELRPYTPRAAQKLGVRVVHQERQIAPDLSVAHNVLLDDVSAGRLGLVTARNVARRAQRELDELGLDLDARTIAGDLTAAQQQLVELARAVHRQAALVVMDEPTASLRRSEVEVLFGVVRGLRRSGTAVLYISHHLNEVFEVADVATVLRNGEKVADFQVADTTTGELVGAMFDRDVSHVRLPRAERDRSTVALAGRGVSSPPVLLPVDVDVRAGEILVLCGAAGSGTSELAEVLSGASSSPTGVVSMSGGKLSGRTRAAARGIGFVPADRKAAGLLLERPIVENLLISRRGWRGWLYWPSAAVALARRALVRGQVKAGDPRRAVSTLSGGNQQRVIFARWLLAESTVLVLDQPTAGVDIAAKFEIYQQLLDLTAEGLAVAMVSSDYEEISCLADRVIVMRDGVVVAELDGDAATPERLYQLEMGDEVPA